MTVTVCGVSQSVVVKVRLVLSRAKSLSVAPPMVTVTSPVGAVSSTTVYVTVAPSSIPSVLSEMVTPAVSSSSIVTDTLPAAAPLYSVSVLMTVCAMVAGGSSAASSSWLPLTYTYFGPQVWGVKVIVPGFTEKPALAGRSTVTVTSDVGSESSSMV